MTLNPLKKSILKQINNLGYRIEKINGDKKLVKSKKNKFTTIELVGPSGIGKTHFSEFLLNNKFTGFNPRKNLTKIEDLDMLLSNVNGLHWKLLNLKVDNLNKSNYKDITKLELINYFCSILIQDRLLKQINNDFHFLLDEGVVHNFASELLQLNKDELSELISNRLIIFLTTSNKELVYEQILKRKKDTGQEVVWQKELKKSEILAKVEDSLANNKILYDKIIDNNLKAIELDISLSHQEKLTILSSKIKEYSL